MSASRRGADLAVLPAVLRALADALDDVLATTQVASAQAAPERLCRWCHHPMQYTMRIDAEYCSNSCRKSAWRKRTGRS